MKRAAALLCTLCLLIACFPASAQTVVPLEATLSADNLALKLVHAVIESYNATDNTLTLALYEAEAFSEEAIDSLEVGDTIVSEGDAYVVKTLNYHSDYVVINEGDYEFSDGSLWLRMKSDGTYQTESYEMNVWNLQARITCPISDTLIFLDGVVPSTGEPLMVPTLHGAEDFAAILKESFEDTYCLGFASHNVYAIFGGNGQLAAICRYYVPWQ